MRWFLGFSALLWSGYGLFCFFDPAYLSGAAGVAADSATGTTEIRAMYGGLQAALGALTGAAFLRDDLRRPALFAIAFLCSGLFVARLSGAALDSGWSAYTGQALGFELVSAGLALWLLKRQGAQAAA
ncbi:MAG: DUF4345 domain-containing protein [Myxococcota bacterium]